MLERILAIIDGSENSRFAVGAGITIAKENHSRVVFCAAVDPELGDAGVGGVGFEDLATQMTQRLLDEALAQARERDLSTATGQIVVDEPVHGVVALAREQQIDLIVLGIKPRLSALRPFVLSLAEEILRETSIPLCVVRRPTNGCFSRRILVPIVADELSEIAVAYATRLATQCMSKLVFCTVDGPDRRSAGRTLDAAKAYATERGVAADELILPLRNGISNAIVENVSINACDSIVMASHVRQGLPRLIEGSVTEAVFYASNVPVIIVRAALAA